MTLPVTTIEVLQLDFEVPFPLSLILSRKTVLRYQLLFRFLMHLKHIEQCLSQMWIDQKSDIWRASIEWHPELDKWRRRVAVLRARMLTVVQQIIAYVTVEVLEPNWRAGLLLHDQRSAAHHTAGQHVANSQLDEVAPP